MYPWYINWHLEIILIRKPKCQLIYPGYIKQHFMVVFLCAPDPDWLIAPWPCQLTVNLFPSLCSVFLCSATLLP